MDARRRLCRPRQLPRIFLSGIMHYLAHFISVCLSALRAKNICAFRQHDTLVQRNLNFVILHIGMDARRHLCRPRQLPRILLTCIMHYLSRITALCLLALCTFDVDAFQHFGTHDRTTHIVFRQYVPCRVDGARGDPVHQSLTSRRRFVRLNLCD